MTNPIPYQLDLAGASGGHRRVSSDVPRMLGFGSGLHDLRDDRALDLMADLAVIGWRVRQAQAAFRWRARSGDLSD